MAETEVKVIPQTLMIWHIHDSLFPWFDTNTSIIRSGGLKYFYGSKPQCVSFWIVWRYQRVIRICISKKNRQHNGQKMDRQHNGQKMDRQHNGQKKKYKQLSKKHTHKTKDKSPFRLACQMIFLLSLQYKSVVISSVEETWSHWLLFIGVCCVFSFVFICNAFLR